MPHECKYMNFGSPHPPRLRGELHEVAELGPESVQLLRTSVSSYSLFVWIKREKTRQL